MTEREYRRLTLAEMKRRRWRTVLPLESKLLALPEGAEVSITGKQKGLSIKSPACPHCGVSVSMMKVAPRYLEEIT